VAIKGRAIGKGNGSKPIKECEHKSIPDAQLEEVVKDMEDEKSKQCRKKSSSAHGAKIGTEEHLSFSIMGYDGVHTILGKGKEGHRQKRKAGSFIRVVMAPVKGPVAGINKVHLL
jgi:hypothetical protein